LYGPCITRKGLHKIYPMIVKELDPGKFRFVQPTLQKRVDTKTRYYVVSNCGTINEINGVPLGTMYWRKRRTGKKESKGR